MEFYNKCNVLRIYGCGIPFVRNTAVLSDHYRSIYNNIVWKRQSGLHSSLDASDLLPTTSPPTQKVGETDVTHPSVFTTRMRRENNHFYKNKCFCVWGHYPHYTILMVTVIIQFFLQNFNTLFTNKVFFYEYIKNFFLFCAKEQPIFATFSRICEQIVNKV